MAIFGDLLDRVRGATNNPNNPTTQDGNLYYELVSKQIEDARKSTGMDNNYIEKGYNGRDVAYTDIQDNDLTYRTDGNTEYRSRPMLSGYGDLHKVLKRYGNNVILRAIINTRANQVTSFGHRASLDENGSGFRVRLKNNEIPTDKQQQVIDRSERFIENMGVDYNPMRDDFKHFLRKLVNDTYIYDDVVWESTYDVNGRLSHVRIIDPTTIYFATDKHGKKLTKGKIFVQIDDNKHVVAKFDTDELYMFVRNPRSEISSMGYGLSELEVGLREFTAHESTEIFNDRFFSHGGTTRGLLNIKPSASQSQSSKRALDDFKRAWTASASGINGSWRIPVLTADDVQFVNMTPQAQDMQFEKWLNYLINIITALYVIDPSEIGFTNRGGATGSKSNSLNEGNNQTKLDESKSKGLSPLLDLIADAINNSIIKKIAGDNYIFEFVGGSARSEQDKINVIKTEVSTFKTVNEAREAQQLDPIVGGDIPLSAVIVQRIGQLMQQQTIDFQQQTQRLQQLESSVTQAMTQPKPQELPSNISYQDIQSGLNGKPAKASNKQGMSGTGKDGQQRDVKNTGSMGQGGKSK